MSFANMAPNYIIGIINMLGVSGFNHFQITNRFVGKTFTNGQSNYHKIYKAFCCPEGRVWVSCLDKSRLGVCAKST